MGGGGSVSSFDYCHSDELSMIELSHMGKELGYGLAKYYQKVQGDFVLVATDKDIMDLGLGFDAKKRVVQIFMKHFEEPNVLAAGTQPSERPTPVVVNEVGDNEDSDDYDPESSLEEDDSDAEFNDSDYNLSDDDNLFEANVDKNAEFIELSNKPEIDNSYKETLDKLANIDGDSDSGSSELSSGCTSSDEEGGSSKREKKKYKVFNEKTDMDNPQFLVGMEFKTHALFRDAVKQHGIKCGKVIKFLKNDKSKVRAVCRGGKRKRYTERIRSNPTWPVKSLAETIEKEWTCKVSLPRVFRAKKKALDLVEGTTNEQFGLLYAYAEEVMSSNPGTRVIIKTKPVDGVENLEPIVEESAQLIVEEIDLAVEQSAHGTSGQVRRNMKKAKQGMVEEGPTQSQPQSQVDLC
ncbi:hypothetical protein Vadar_017319 [Vaccinium darrowii]|uniref:Uncharacterized protein n=1 Tax=Vaccinium darrowii TaxID=229202 RepID=A0ACB7XSR3_9ERIC|nr:hypothetical protein Vadar_017319 [Vaccinium darrowii]